MKYIWSSLNESFRRPPGCRKTLISLESGFHRSDRFGVVQSFLGGPGAVKPRYKSKTMAAYFPLIPSRRVIRQ